MTRPEVTNFFALLGLDQTDTDLADWLVMRARLDVRLTDVSGAQLNSRARVA
ncbi:hypothetical protein [Amycolatopsis sp.]|uniref:hypothetical protein n=1 Tax=Amycolatopsis sp. TaxID=37632 RepID=UPI0026019940|nr:hypothetical protein [Amycolatopsis sp.]